MVQIRELDKKLDKGHVKLIATLHQRAFPRFFLTQLGRPFLNALYTGYMEDKDSGIIVAQNGERVEGFIAYSNDYSSFFRGLVRHHLLRFAICSFTAAIRHPSFIKRLFGAFAKSDSVAKTERYVELASICVDPNAEGSGIGTALIAYLKKKTDFSKFAYINLETDADYNDRANSFYVKNGFRLFRTYATNEGRRMNEYRYSPEKNESGES